MDGFFNTLGVLDGYLDGIIGTYANATSAASASIAYDRLGIHKADGADETYVFSTCSASFTPIRHSHGNPRHSFNLTADSVIEMGQYAPYAAAGAAIADGQ